MKVTWRNRLKAFGFAFYGTKAHFMYGHYVGRCAKGDYVSARKASAVIAQLQREKEELEAQLAGAFELAAETGRNTSYHDGDEVAANIIALTPADALPAQAKRDRAIRNQVRRECAKLAENAGTLAQLEINSAMKDVLRSRTVEDIWTGRLVACGELKQDILATVEKEE